MKESKIPKNLEETYTFLSNMKSEDLTEWLNIDISKAIGIAHHGIGRWIRNNFGLWEQKPNELKQWFIDNHIIDHPDDISSLILKYYHMKKNGLKPDLTEDIIRYHKHWEKCYPNYNLKLRKHKLNKLKKLCSK